MIADDLQNKKSFQSPLKSVSIVSFPNVLVVSHILTSNLLLCFLPISTLSW